MTSAALSAGTTLPPYRVTARATGEAFENKIHENELARQYGFRGGLVPGVVVYAWMTRPVMEALGMDWLERGGFAARFARPIYYGEPATVEATVTERTADRLAIEALARDRSNEVCARATFTLDEGPASPPPAARYPAAALPSARAPVTREILAGQPVLGTPAGLVDREAARAFLDKVSDDWPPYAGPAAPVHPGYYLDQANKALSLNVVVSPWVHVESEGRHFGVARVGERLETRARVDRLFEKKGHEFVELDCLLLAEGTRPVARVRHVAIYRLRPPA
jgi:acyl dehydratase